MTFGIADWNHPFTVTVSADPAAPPGGGGQPVQVFPAQPHVVQNIFGPLVIEGGQIEDRALRQGIRLPTETDVPLPVLDIHVDETQTNDTLNVFNDGSVSAMPGSGLILWGSSGRHVGEEVWVDGRWAAGAGRGNQTYAALRRIMGSNFPSLRAWIR